MKTINIKQTDFKEMILSNNLYVDKTLFIKKFIDESSSISWITIPKHFGKTLNLSMLRYFFDMNSDKSLFNGLNISKEREICEKHQNKYPVIYISFENCKCNSWEEFMDQARKNIAQMYKEHDYLKDMLEGGDLEEYLAVCNNEDILHYSYSSSLRYLVGYIKRALKIDAIVLIDACDVPQEYAYVINKKFFDEISYFFGDFSDYGLKDLNGLEKAVIISKFKCTRSSLWSGSSIVFETEDDYPGNFGFTEDEVKWLLQESKSELKIEEMREWYGGYEINGYHMYNPKSVLLAISNNNIGLYLDSADCTKDVVWPIIEQNTRIYYKEPLNELIDNPKSTSLINRIDRYLGMFGYGPKEDGFSLYSLLVAYGYLAAIEKGDSYNRSYDLRIPNKEVFTILSEFLTKIKRK